MDCDVYGLVSDSDLVVVEDRHSRLQHFQNKGLLHRSHESKEKLLPEVLMFRTLCACAGVQIKKESLPCLVNRGLTWR